MQTSPDYIGIARKLLSNSLGDSMTDKWSPKVADDPKDDFVIVSGTIVDKTGEDRSFSILIMRSGIVNLQRSFVSPKLLTPR